MLSHLCSHFNLIISSICDELRDFCHLNAAETFVPREFENVEGVFLKFILCLDLSTLVLIFSRSLLPNTSVLLFPLIRF